MKIFALTITALTLIFTAPIGSDVPVDTAPIVQVSGSAGIIAD